MVALAGMAMEPVPNGQMPAIARNSVDLPEPEGPVTSVRSSLRKLNPSAFTSGLPFGRLHGQPLEVDGAVAGRLHDVNPVVAGGKLPCR